MALWRTDTHWYRPIRRTDEARFFHDMHAAWIACGAITQADLRRESEETQVAVYEAVLREYYAPLVTELGRHLR